MSKTAPITLRTTRGDKEWASCHLPQLNPPQRHSSSRNREVETTRSHGRSLRSQYLYPTSLPLLSSFDGMESRPERSDVSPPIQLNGQSPKHLPQGLLPSPSSDETSPRRGRTPKRRCVSADAALRARGWFTSPDRFVPSRPSPWSEERPIHSSRHPSTLTPRERYSRSRDHRQNPFRSSPTSGSQYAIRRRPQTLETNPQTTHITPHFVNANNNNPLQRDDEGHVDVPRQISAGAVWNVGGRSAAQGGPLPGVPDGQGGLLTSGSSAPMYTARFLDRETPDEDLHRHENRVAVALDIDPAGRILSPTPVAIVSREQRPSSESNGRYVWRDNAWSNDDSLSSPKLQEESQQRAVPSTPFRVLDAPRLRDDFYCSPLAYSSTARALAVGLSSRVYLWSENGGVQYPPFNASRSANYITSLSFSSTDGGKSILAIGRQGGQLSLWSCIDTETRFEAQQPNAVSCVLFKHTVSRRASEYFVGQQFDCEDLLVGDDMGNVYYYSLEWPTPELHQRYPDWTGTMTLLAKVAAHSQQICGLAWSPNGRYFVTGGNDNTALLFDVSRILGARKPLKRRRSHGRPSSPKWSPFSRPTILSPPPDQPRGRSPERGSSERRSASPPPPRRLNPNAPEFTYRRISARTLTAPPTMVTTPTAPRPPVNLITPPRTPSPITTTPAHRFPNLPSTTSVQTSTTFHPGNNTSTLYHPPRSQTRTFHHTAAVKALAFAPWQPTLLASGGGSNDRQIHFFHTGSGATLATINVHAQVTSLIWSRTRREICATFGYAQPEHGVRIAVFSWPSGNCVVAIPWGDPSAATPGSTVDVGRALWAIPYPGGPNNRNRGGSDRGEGEGGTWWSRTEEEGCVIVASSDESVKFHEVWAGGRKGAKTTGFGGSPGLGELGGVLGGSRILEGVAEEIDIDHGIGGPGTGMGRGMIIR